jgi:hypothetical protein
MRALALAVLFGFVLSVSALAQDPAMQASQAAIEASQQASQAAMQASQQANQAAMQANQQAMQNAQAAANNTRDATACLAPKPVFSVKAGAYGGPQTVFITDKGRQAAIYYTVDGWTPTDRSARYGAPVTVDTTTRLQAVAFVPGCVRSQVAEAVYTLPAKDVALPVAVGADGILRAGTGLELKFVTAVDSATAKVGDALDLELENELRVGTQVIAPGTLKAKAVITAVNRPASFGRPGEISFAVQAITVDGVQVPLDGVRTAEGADKYDKVRHRVLIPVANLSALAIHGYNAEIAPGATVTGRVTADTRLPVSMAQGSGQ